MKVLGIDPGIRGALAIVLQDSDSVAKLVDVIDIPVLGPGAKERVDIIAIQAWFSQHRPQIAFIERAQAMPKHGASSGFKSGRAVGALEAVITLSAVPLELVEPSQWKQFFHLPGKDKELARKRAVTMFPDKHELLARKRDHGRAEAGLIAMFRLRTGVAASTKPASLIPQLAESAT
jgi:Holliday junction resolvasome RuvABC endonuclease subunit